MRLKKHSPLIIALAYLLFGSLWIFLSDKFLEQHSGADKNYYAIETIKGLVFVLCSAVLIFSVAKFLTRRIARMETDFKLTQAQTLKELSSLHVELHEIRQEGNIGHWQLDPETMYVTISDEIHSIFEPVAGIKEETAQQLFQIIDEVQRKELQNVLSYSLEHKTPFVTTFTFETEGKSKRYFQVKAKFVTESLTGKEILSGTIKDVSLEVEYLQTKQEMILDMVNWCSIVSHQLRKPLVTFAGLTDILSEKGLHDQELSRILTYFECAFEEMDANTRRFGQELAVKQKQLRDSLLISPLEKSKNDFPDTVHVA